MAPFGDRLGAPEAGRLRLDGEDVHEACFHTLPVFSAEEIRRATRKDLGAELRASAVAGDALRVAALLADPRLGDPNAVDNAGGGGPNNNSTKNNKNNEDSALHLACAVGSVGVVRALLEDGRVVADQRNARLETATHLAAQGGFEEICDVLARHPASLADVAAADADGETPASVARRQGHAALADSLEAWAAEVPSMKVTAWALRESRRVAQAAGRVHVLYGRKLPAHEAPELHFASAPPLGGRGASTTTTTTTTTTTRHHVARVARDHAVAICAASTARLLVDAVVSGVRDGARAVVANERPSPVLLRRRGAAYDDDDDDDDDDDSPTTLLPRKSARGFHLAANPASNQSFDGAGAGNSSDARPAPSTEPRLLRRPTARRRKKPTAVDDFTLLLPRPSSPPRIGRGFLQ